MAASAGSYPRRHAPGAVLGTVATTIAMFLGLAPAIPASAAPAAPTTSAATAAHAPRTAPAANDGATWQIQPSSKNGPTSRPYFVYGTAPGATVSDYVGVTNLAHTPLTVNVYTGDGYNVAGNGTFDVRPATVKAVDVGSWVRLARREITIAPRSRADIPFTVKVPANATPGDHVGGIVASVTSVTANASGAKVAVERRIGTRMYVSVSGPTVSRLSIEDVRTSFSDAANPLHFGKAIIQYTVTNRGNTRLGAHQQLKLSGPLGLGGWSESLPDLPELLPGSSIKRTATVSSPAAFRLTARLGLDPYRVADPAMPAAKQSAITAPQSGASVTVRQGLWAIAWWNIAALVIALALLAWFVRSLARRVRSRSADGTARREDEATVIDQ